MMRLLPRMLAPLAEPRPDPGRYWGLGNYVAMGETNTLGTAIKWGSIGSIALLGGFLLLLWKDSKRPILRRNPFSYAKRRFKSVRRAKEWR